MKRIILTLAILASVSLTSFAATNVDQQDRKGKRDFPKELKLTEDQKKQMDEINKDFDQKIEAVKRTRIVESVQQERIQKLKEEKREAVGKILTPAQKEQFAKRMSKDRKGTEGKRGDMKRPGRDGNRFGDGRMRGDFFKDLNLTDDQKAKIEELKKSQSEDREKMQSKYKEEFSKILTPEQQAKLKEKKEKPEGRRQGMDKFNKLDDAGKAKLKEMRESYEKEKSAIEKTRIAPDMQKKKLSDLKEKYKKDREELFDSIK